LADIQAARGGVRKLGESIGRVIGLACRADADARRFPKHWLFHVRWDACKPGTDVICESRPWLKVDTVGGRTTIICEKTMKIGGVVSSKKKTAASITKKKAVAVVSKKSTSKKTTGKAAVTKKPMQKKKTTTTTMKKKKD